MSLARTVYTALAGALLPYARVRLRWRARKDAGYAEHVEERFGHYDHVVDGQPLIWIHAVSVGETRAAAPLVDALSAAHPSHRILLTHMTPTGRRTSEALFADRVMRAYVPYDYPAAVSRFSIAVTDGGRTPMRPAIAEVVARPPSSWSLWISFR